MFDIHHATVLLMIKERERKFEKIRQIMERPEDMISAKEN